jgi:hypothetical protein
MTGAAERIKDPARTVLDIRDLILVDIKTPPLGYLVIYLIYSTNYATHMPPGNTQNLRGFTKMQIPKIS